MSTKWLEKLSNEELLKLHGYVLGEGIADSVKTKETYGDILSITFLEKGWEGIDGTLETNYDFDDFNGIEVYDWASSEDTKKFDQLFREWMINRFGVKYVDELIKEVLGVNLIDYLDWSKDKEENTNENS